MGGFVFKRALGPTVSQLNVIELLAASLRAVALG